jgi:hypothetical protein
MAPTLEAFLGRALEVGEIEVAGPLTVLPLFAPWARPAARWWRTGWIRTRPRRAVTGRSA